MFEFARVLIEALTKLIPSAALSRQEAKRRKIGASLFLLHVYAHEVANNGDSIVSLLEEARSVAESPRARRDPLSIHSPPRERWAGQMSAALHLQDRALTSLGSAIQRWGTHMAVVEPETYGQLRRLLWFKGSALAGLTDRLGHAELVTAAPGSVWPPEVDRSRTRFSP